MSVSKQLKHEHLGRIKVIFGILYIINSHIEEPKIEEPGRRGCDSIDISKIQYNEMRNIVSQTGMIGRAAILVIATLITCP